MNITTFCETLGIDYDNIVEDFCGDMGALRAAIEDYGNLARSAQLKETVASGDDGKIHTLAHSLRKGAEKLSLKELARLAGKLETCEKERRASLVEPMEKELSVLLRTLDE